MTKLIKVKNATGAVGTWVGQQIANDMYYELQEHEKRIWAQDSLVFADVANGNLIVNKGVDITDDFVPGVEAWNYFEGEDLLPRSNLDNTKVAVHASTKPFKNAGNKDTYAVWAGTGDDIVNHTIAGGPLLHFNLSVGMPSLVIDVKYDPLFGRVWLHQGFLKFTNGGDGDCMDAVIMSEPTPLQTAVNLDLVITSNWISFAPGGAGTGTHGWADATKIVLIPRTFSQDGEWDYDGTNLIPNTTSTGLYKISDIERQVHHYVQKIPCVNTNSSYFALTSEETTELPPNYFVRCTATNSSNTAWDASIVMLIYRERTSDP